MDNHTVKQNILQSRRQSHLSQQEMADKLGMSRNAYRDLEQGKTKIINGNLEQIAQITGTSTEKLILGFTPRPQDNNSYLEAIGSLEARVRDLEDKLKLRDETIDFLEKNNELLREIADRLTKQLTASNL